MIQTNHSWLLPEDLTIHSTLDQSNKIGCRDHPMNESHCEKRKVEPRRALDDLNPLRGPMSREAPLTVV